VLKQACAHKAACPALPLERRSLPVFGFRSAPAVDVLLVLRPRLAVAGTSAADRLVVLRPVLSRADRSASALLGPDGKGIVVLPLADQTAADCWRHLPPQAVAS